MKMQDANALDPGRKRSDGKLLCCLLGLLLAVTVAHLLINRPKEHAEAGRNDLSQMKTATVRIKSKVFTVWLAQTPREKRLGLMRVLPDEISGDQGMLFVFSEDQEASFWMKNTYMPLEIAFLAADGTVVDVQRMEPLSLRLHRPAHPYRYALEVKAPALSRLGLKAGDIVVLPEELLNHGS